MKNTTSRKHTEKTEQRTQARSDCPINLTMEVLGDRWSLVVIRDIMFGNRRHFRELLNKSMEGIASNILAARLKRLTELGFITWAEDPSHKQKGIYSLTEKAIQLVPVFAMIGAWGRKHTPVSEELSVRAQLLEEGGPPVWEAFMDELRAVHLRHAPPATDGVLGRLDAAHQDAVKRAAKRG
jgi:DNA-binding HxlR family transcriptional regulator